MPQTRNDTEKRPVGAQRSRVTGGPTRQCIATRATCAPDEMIRFVRSPDGIAVPDVSEKLPGRGAWVSANLSAVEKAVSTDAFSRSFKAKTVALENLAHETERQLVAKCAGLIGMAKKSGQAVIGFDQVRAYIRKDPPGWLLEASDGAKDSRNKVHFLAKAIYEDVKVAGALTSTELGMALGREHVIHALLHEGRLAKTFGAAYRRLTGFREAPETSWFAGRD